MLPVLVGYDAGLRYAAAGFVIDAGAAAAIAENPEVVGLAGSKSAKRSAAGAIINVFVVEVVGHRDAVYRVFDVIEARIAHTHQVTVGQHRPFGVCPA